MTAGARRVALAAGLLLCASPLLRSASADGGQTRLFQYLMGTSMRIEAYGADALVRQQAAAEGFADIEEVDRVMSSYRDDSELTAMNRDAATRPVAVSAPLFAVMSAAAQVARLSDGALDITVRPAALAWGAGARQPRTPTPAELDTLRPLVSFRNLTLDPTRRTVRLARPGMSIELGTLARGFAAGLAAGSLRQRGLSGIVDTGGVLAMVGAPPGKPHWSVGIEQPGRRGALLGAIDVDAAAVATASVASANPSGQATPLLDPRTLQPAVSSLSATVVAQDGTLAAALATALFVLGPARGLALLDAFPDAWAVVASPRSDGGVAVAVSPGHLAAYHPVALRQ